MGNAIRVKLRERKDPSVLIIFFAISKVVLSSPKISSRPLRLDSDAPLLACDELLGQLLSHTRGHVDELVVERDAGLGAERRGRGRDRLRLDGRLDEQKTELSHLLGDE